MDVSIVDADRVGL